VPPSTFSVSRQPSTVRCFWHGSSLGPYQLVGLRSFVDRGHQVEIYTYDYSGIEVPGWITRKDAREIWPADHVMCYQNQTDIGRGSFALHSNLFRYALLFEMGGWWIDLDVVLLRPELPQQEIFFSIESLDPLRATFSVLKFPKGHPAMREALEKCVTLGETPFFGETGADLFTEMVAKYDLAKFGQPMELTFPLSALDVPSLFDPAQYDELLSRCEPACFLHLFNETWRRAGIPRSLGPPEGSLIDYLLQRHGFDAPSPRMELADLKRWTAYLRLHEEYQAGQRAFRLSNEALRARVAALEQQNADLRSSPLLLWGKSISRQLRRVLSKMRRSYRALG
jgi:Glycosyltransferase sugar-binding region containing DXD motif